MSGILPSELGQLREIKNLDFRDYIIGSTETVARKKTLDSTIPSEYGLLKEW